MRYLGKQLTIIIIILLLIFLLLTALNVDDLLNPSNWHHENTSLTAMIMIFILASDVLLPVPSSLVMTINGTLFGVVAGAVYSTIGCVLASCLGFLIGRLSFFQKFLSNKYDQHNYSTLLDWGIVAIILTRPLPLIAESFAIIAGARNYNFKLFLLASIAGSIPISIIYAQIGAGIILDISLVYLSFIYLFISGILFIFSRCLRFRLIK